MDRLIVDAILGLFESVMIWLVSFFPETNIDFGTTGLGSYLQSANQFINMPLLISFVSVFIANEVTVLTARLIIWVWNTLKP